MTHSHDKNLNDFEIDVLKDMGTKSSDGYKVFIAIVSKLCEALTLQYLCLFSKSN